MCARPILNVQCYDVVGSTDIHVKCNKRINEKVSLFAFNIIQHSNIYTLGVNVCLGLINISI